MVDRLDTSSEEIFSLKGLYSLEIYYFNFVS
jgi:hypothetical protein